MWNKILNYFYQKYLNSYRNKFNKHFYSNEPTLREHDYKEYNPFSI